MIAYGHAALRAMMHAARAALFVLPPAHAAMLCRLFFLMRDNMRLLRAIRFILRQRAPTPLQMMSVILPRRVSI